jgi:hypothetical protein
VQGVTISRKFFFSRHKFGFLFSEARIVPKNSICTGWTVRGSNPGGSEIVRIRPNRPWGTPSLRNNGYRDIPGSKAAGVALRAHTRSAGVKERLELYLYAPTGPLWPVLGLTSPFFTTQGRTQAGRACCSNRHLKQKFCLHHDIKPLKFAGD